MEPLCLVHERFEWMRASLDGLSFDGSTVLEIKCPLSVRDLNAAQQGRVPSHYYGQLQHQLEVSGAAEAHYWSFDGRVGRLVRIRPDRDYMKRLVDEEGEFWRRVKENRWPELDDKELDMSSDPRWRSLALQYRQAQGSAGCGDCAGAQAEGHSGPHGDRAAHLRLWSGGPEELSQGNRRLRGDSATIRGRPGDVPQASGRGDQDQCHRIKPGSLEIGTGAVLIAAMDEYLSFRNFRQFERTRREIRLPYDLLNDVRFRQLSDARKAHLLCLLLLAARMDNFLPNHRLKLERLIGATEILDLSELAEFIEVAALERPSYEDRWASRRIPDSVKAAVIVRDGGRCRDCYSAVNLQIDHIVPLSKGGSSEESNLQTLCRRCNRRKWKKLVPRF